MLPQILAILRFIFIAIEVLVVFNLMIIVHELGHFLAAKWRGMVIESFGIWFGTPLWKKTIGGVEYSFGSIPFGGFVKLPQMADMETIEGKTETPQEALPKASPLDKIIVAFAGPLFSFGLAVVFAAVVWAVGRPVSEGEKTTTVGYVLPDSPAARAGMKIGDKILSVDGYPVSRYIGMARDSIKWDIVRSEGDVIPITVERIENGVARTIPLSAKPIIEHTNRWWTRRPLREVGILPAQRPMVAKVKPGSTAEKAGLKPSDLITGIDGQPAYSLDAITDYVKDHPGPAFTLQVERDGKTISVPFAPSGARVDEVMPDSPASKSGIKSGDTITAVDGKTMRDSAQVSEYIRAHGNQPVVITVLNDSGRHDLPITPLIAVEDKEPHIGLAWEKDEFGIVEDVYGKFHLDYPRPVEQVHSAMMSVFNTIGAIASSKSDVKLQDVGGPLMMMRVYYTFFQSREGARLALWFSVVLNVNLALLNLLPIPVLDGGHITLAIVEAIRRRPVNVRILEAIQTGCALVIIGFMLYIAFFDVQDYFGERLEHMRFLPKSPTPAQSQR